MHNNHVVIMAGGIGSRFWPISTPERPKQFIDILGCGRTLIQLTMDRFEGVCSHENFWVVTNATYVDIVHEQLPSIPKDHILAEPEARNTAPCIAWACWTILKQCPSANIVVTPSDAVVMNTVEFRRIISSGLNFTARNYAILTIGIRPSRPETGYGYIELSENGGEEIQRVNSFKEKPSLELAKFYLKKGIYLWNAGIFIWTAETIKKAISLYCPDIAALMDQILDSGDVEQYFPLCRKISIDYALLEPSANAGIVYTHAADFGWSDLGNWVSLSEKLSKDDAGNCSVGPVLFHECSDCVAHVESAKRVVLQGLTGYIVAEKNGNILICPCSEEQRIREFSFT